MRGRPCQEHRGLPAAELPPPTTTTSSPPQSCASIAVAAVDALALEAGVIGNVELAVARTRGNHHGAGPDRLAVVENHTVRLLVAGEARAWREMARRAPNFWA